MEGLEKLLQGWQLHPVADHFTIALLTVAILIDLVASLLPARVWLRNTALTLMVLGALAAAASYSTGDIEVDRVWEMMSQPAKNYFKGGGVALLGHGALGYYLMIAFAVLTVWRILIALFNFMAGSRSLYLLLAFIALVVLLYQGHTGGELVYSYGIGTGGMAPGATPAAAPTPAASPTAIPTVFVPQPTPTASASESATTIASPTTAGTATPIATSRPIAASARARSSGWLVAAPPADRRGRAGRFAPFSAEP